MSRFNRIPLLCFAVLALVLCSCEPMEKAGEITLYVSPDGDDSWAGDSIKQPFATIHRARDAVRTLKEEGKPVTVYLRGGRYELAEPLIFTPQDSGTEACPITYKAYFGEKPIISGGRRITAPWKTNTGDIMVCSIGEVREGTWNFRQLFVNGKRQIRSRLPNKGHYKIEEPVDNSSFIFKEGHIKPWQNLTDVEVVVYHSWNESRLLISELDEQKRVVRFSGPIGRRLGTYGAGRNRYHVENVLEGLQQPGEWYLDRHTGNLYYWPVDDLDKSEIIAPVLHELVRFEGDGDDHVQYITMSGITFSDSDWALPEEGYPSCGDVGDIVKPSAITLEGASHCVFEGNCVKNVGTYAFEITGYDNHIIGNEIFDTGSGGIISRNYSEEPNVMSYNHIHHCGDIYASGVGINIDDGGGVVSHNLIHDISHSGVYGRHWATEFQPRERRNQVQELIIEYNEIYDVSTILNDASGVFIRDSNIIINNNIIHDVYSYYRGTPGWGIYLGCETRDTTVKNNIVYRTRETVHVWYSNRNNTIENNIFIEGELSHIYYQNPKDRRHENIKTLRNIFYSTKTDADLFRIDNERSAPAVSDYNLFFNTRGCIWSSPIIAGMPGIDSFEEWQKTGYDTHSIVADPLFVDAANDDYSLKPDSPAFQLGFKPIDVSTVGLRGKQEK